MECGEFHGFFLSLYLLRYLDRQRRKGDNIFVADTGEDVADQLMGDAIIGDSLR